MESNNQFSSFIHFMSVLIIVLSRGGWYSPQQILYFYQGKIGLFLYGTVECHDIGFKDKSGPCYGNSSTGGNLGSIMESDVSDVMLHGDIVESTCSDVIWMQEDHEM